MTRRVGDEVHVPGMGTGVVREVRNRGRYLVEIKGRAMVVDDGQLETVARRSRAGHAGAPPAPPPDDPASASSTSLDLHGLTVEEALDALDRFLSDALLAGHTEARVIHGRSGGRLKAAVHARLGQVPSVRRFRVDPVNAGVTIVAF